MASLDIKIKKDKRSKRMTIEIDADKFQKLAELFGQFNPDFIKRLDKAEKDVKAGRIRKINSLKDLDK